MRTSSPVTIAAVLILTVLPVLYVLSIGPAAWLVGHGVISAKPGSPASTFYRPLEWLASQTPVTDRALHWYVGLWRRFDPEAVSGRQPFTPRSPG